MSKKKNRYNKRYLGVVKFKNTEKVGIYEQGVLIGFTGNLKKGIKADLNKIQYLNLIIPILRGNYRGGGIFYQLTL